MNKITALEKAQNSSYISKGKPFPKRKSEEDKPSSSQVRNTLVPSNAVEQDSSFEDEQSESDESDDDETNEQANLVESDIFNILLGGSYTHPPISEVKTKYGKEELILNVDASNGRFKGVQYSRKDNNKDPTTSKGPNKDDSLQTSPSQARPS